MTLFPPSAVLCLLRLRTTTELGPLLLLLSLAEEPVLDTLGDGVGEANSSNCCCCCCGVLLLFLLLLVAGLASGLLRLL